GANFQLALIEQGTHQHDALQTQVGAAQLQSLVETGDTKAIGLRQRVARLDHAVTVAIGLDHDHDAAVGAERTHDREVVAQGGEGDDGADCVLDRAAGSCVGSDRCGIVAAGFRCRQVLMSECRLSTVKRPMNHDKDRLVIAISSRALFNLSDSHRIYESEGLDAFAQYQIAHEETPLEPGEGFQLVQKLLDIHRRLERPRVDVILLSRNSADTGLRIFNSIQHYKLPIFRAAFCGGESPYRYIQAFGCHLFLSTDANDVRQALEQGVAAATLLPS